MKHNLFRLLIALTVTAVLSIACSTGAVKEQKQIASACAAITATSNAIAANAETAPAGEAKVKAKAIAAKAVVIVKPTKDWCEPKPAAHLSPDDYAALLMAATDLATLKKENTP